MSLFGGSFVAFCGYFVSLRIYGGCIVLTKRVVGISMFN